MRVSLLWQDEQINISFALKYASQANVYNTKVFYTNISWEAKEIIAWDFCCYSPSFIPTSRSLSTTLPCLLMESKWFSRLQLPKTIWPLSLVFLKYCCSCSSGCHWCQCFLSKSFHAEVWALLAQRQHFPDTFTWTAWWSHPLRAVSLQGYLRLCISIWTKDAQAVGTESLQEWGGRRRLLWSLSQGNFIASLTERKLFSSRLSQLLEMCPDKLCFYLISSFSNISWIFSSQRFFFMLLGQLLIHIYWLPRTE